MKKYFKKAFVVRLSLKFFYQRKLFRIIIGSEIFSKSLKFNFVNDVKILSSTFIKMFFVSQKTM